jgi:hypothetical protein
MIELKKAAERLFVKGLKGERCGDFERYLASLIAVRRKNILKF